MKFADIVGSIGDFSDLDRNDVALKFWLPEAAEKAMKEVFERGGDSMSTGLRQFFAMHCYGVYAYCVMTDRIPGLFKEKSDGYTAFSRRVAEPPPGKKRVTTYWVPELGKNVAPIKVWIPQRMKDDLQILADHTGIKLSQYAREIVISRLLGHGMLPSRPQMVVAHPAPAIEDWCEDRDIHLREATYEEYCESALGKVREEWVDDDNIPANTAD